MKQNENHIEMKFFGFDITHDELSKSIDLEPTSIWSKGDNWQSGKLLKTRKENYWCYAIITETDGYIGDQARAFLDNVIAPRLDKIKLLSSKYYGEFSIVQYMYDGYNPGFCLNKKQLALLCDSGLELNVDIYVLTGHEQSAS